MDKDLGRLLYNYLLKTGMTEGLAAYINLFVMLIVVLVLVMLLDVLIWKVLRALSVRLARKSKNNFDNFLVAHRVPRYIAHIVPLTILLEFVPVAFTDFEYAGIITLKTIKILFVFLTLIILRKFFKSVNGYLKTRPKFRDKPINSYVQVFMIFAWVVGLLTIFVIVTDTTVWKFFTALGAASAVILLIFKDSILGFVASIQVTINDMVRIGDWITFEKYGADGDVVEISLATVKVQNFDMTITTIPTYALISDSFKNWRGMQVSGGRRIKRSLIIRQKSIRFLTEEEIEKLKKIQLVEGYIGTRNEQIRAYNEENNINKEVLVNGRNLTNFGVFRKYVTNYLENHSAINKKMTLMVRQLQPTPQGIPLEIYAFSSDKRWENYEYVMADIFDHLLAALPYFSLELFELPVAKDYVSTGDD
ncbi:mechanosensitive ion channel family protein [Flagellimonas halotolerans]|uniref:Mechanosensitive ion channel domain-containing protein n=1 Tax=Flagellimonas halotolerans TaxID=3112164 RepID=A0ABU6IRW4_9FLAO|nr:MULTISPECIES: mechanosensitive ion channel domain-containing protein [unclassified Allomuricauda]MEC3966084.1 mechanosensitive ion channel domain-containing protein [Muricauda sp. SYSU M86414]MEC4265806.1 mechanosensitive ion channel domain-containing protein [Muricauda sp. SYSU M84420]